jgi:hypothetical protein
MAEDIGQWSRTAAIEIYLPLNFVVVFSFKVFAHCGKIDVPILLAHRTIFAPKGKRGEQKKSAKSKPFFVRY